MVICKFKEQPEKMTDRVRAYAEAMERLQEKQKRPEETSDEANSNRPEGRAGEVDENE
ncbi:MAG: hypothetical protein LUG93_13805 [Lachnospiraceae bacterium]|nr:hypothetical protein [Lachnospiraceae bacterium]